MLTDIAVKNSKPKDKSYKLYDAYGLYLEVAPNGGKYWRFKYRFSGKEKRLSIGIYPLISLVEAREKRDQARKNLTENIDPAQAKMDARIQSTIDKEKSFEHIALHFLSIL